MKQNKDNIEQHKAAQIREVSGFGESNDINDIYTRTIWMISFHLIVVFELAKDLILVQCTKCTKHI